MITAEIWKLLDRRMDRAVARVPRAVRGVIESWTGSTRAATVSMQARAGETAQAEVAEAYGFTSSPPAGVEVVAVPVGGSSAHLVVIGQMDRDHRPVDLEAGEVVVYNAGGAEVRLKADGKVFINGGGAAVARAGDPVAIGAASLTALNAILATVTTQTVVELTGTVTDGSATVEAG